MYWYVMVCIGMYWYMYLVGIVVCIEVRTEYILLYVFACITRGDVTVACVTENAAHEEIEAKELLGDCIDSLQTKIERLNVSSKFLRKGLRKLASVCRT